jgi:hypothetical protein
VGQPHRARTPPGTRPVPGIGIDRPRRPPRSAQVPSHFAARSCLPRTGHLPDNIDAIPASPHPIELAPTLPHANHRHAKTLRGDPT